MQCQSELVHLVVLALCLVPCPGCITSPLSLGRISFPLCVPFLLSYLILLHEYPLFGARSFLMDWYDHLPNMMIFLVAKTALTPADPWRHILSSYYSPNWTFFFSNTSHRCLIGLRSVEFGDLVNTLNTSKKQKQQCALCNITPFIRSSISFCSCDGQLSKFLMHSRSKSLSADTSGSICAAFFEAWAMFVSFAPSLLYPHSTFQSYPTGCVCEGWAIYLALPISPCCSAQSFLILKNLIATEPLSPVFFFVVFFFKLSRNILFSQT